MKVAVVMQDERMKYIAKRLKQKTSVYEIPINDNIQSDVLFDVVVLPMSGISDHNFIKQLFKYVRPNAMLFTGVVNEMLLSQNVVIVNLSKNNKLKNVLAELTAHGILNILITKTNQNFKNYTYDVLGYGACGKEMIKVLVSNGCDVRCVSRQSNPKINCKHYSYEQWNRMQPSDIVINTAAACVIDEHTVSSWLKEPFIIDIASKGIGVKECLKKEYNVLQVGSLPTISGPLSAANSICDCIEEELGL